MYNQLQLVLSQRDFNKLTSGLKEVFQYHLKWHSDLNFVIINCSENLEKMKADYKSNCNGRLKTLISHFNQKTLSKNSDLSSLIALEEELTEIISIISIEQFSNVRFNNHYASMKKLYDEFMTGLIRLLYSNLEACVNIDFLTQLPNRHALDVLLNMEHNRVTINDKFSCLSLIDIDMFKHINDNFGHPVGDLVLKSIAKVLADNIRHCDFIARFGGEEFLLYLPNTSLKQGELLAEYLRMKVESSTMKINDNTFVQATCSFGISSFDQGKSIEKAIVDADIALYTAKKSGRNKVVVN